MSLKPAKNVGVSETLSVTPQNKLISSANPSPMNGLAAKKVCDFISLSLI